MPIEYKVYGCVFKCGQKHIKSLKKMIEHENTCWYNPVNKTCITCKYGELIHEYDPHDEMESCPAEEYRYRVCNHSDEAHDEYYKYIQSIKNYKTKHYADIAPMVNCNNWETK